MKIIAIILLSTLLASCSPFDKNMVIKYKADLNNLVSKLEKYDDGTYDTDEIDEFIIEDIRELDIDIIVENFGKKNSNYSGFIEENDSLIIFINTTNNIFDVEQRIIYDFNKNPRNFGNEKILGASYDIVQLDERWYYSKTGFD